MNKYQEGEELRELLQSWDLTDLIPRLEEETINVEELQMMKRHHLDELMSNFRMGTRIRFEHHLELWRRSLNVPLQGVHWSRPHCHGCRCATIQLQTDCASDCGKSDISLTERHSPRETVPDAMQPILEPVQILSTSPVTNLNVEVQYRTVPDAMQPILEPVQILSTSPVTNSNVEDGGEYVPGEDLGVTVLGILQAEYIKSQTLLELVGQQEELSAEQRQLLIQLICSYFEDHQLHLSLHHSYKLENEILQLFPKELLEHYRTKKRGKIYARCSYAKNKRGRSSPQDAKRRRVAETRDPRLRRSLRRL
ncbi:GL19272 [Drosophila persimilis]|uniref:GL19272 n=1 Tax=Drosophila persimilis TaxID=7234 RepID=B4G8B7_DROPE|nr:GL19272 [Drosophila persimilis]